MVTTKMVHTTFLFECDTKNCPVLIEFNTRLKKRAIEKLKNMGWYYKKGHVHCPKHWPKGNHQRVLEVE